jgi:hypothetical protein
MTASLLRISTFVITSLMASHVGLAKPSKPERVSITFPGCRYKLIIKKAICVRTNLSDLAIGPELAKVFSMAPNSC